MNWQLLYQDLVINLHPQYHWSNEYDWRQLAQSEPQRTLCGSVVIEQALKTGGRLIHLDSEHARISRKVLSDLQNWAALSEVVWTLKHPDGREFQVVFAATPFLNIREFKTTRADAQNDADILQVDLEFITV